MPWLARDGELLAELELLESAAARTRGLLGRDAVAGGVLLRPANAVHTFGMRFAVDVAHCDRDLVVLRTALMVPGRVGRPILRARAVLEAQAGSFDRWSLRPGQRLEVVDADAAGAGGARR